MTNYQSLSGFVYQKSEYIEELDANLVTYVHEKTEMPLFFCDRKDENKTFAIGFRTAPTDDTGVFHILEHSVLSGSEKYPVKDPFTQMLKSSVSTYLNALTYPDRTVYPVSSKNSKAFLDLTSVYLDAVFHPLALRNENIFLSEGHRVEIDTDGTPRVNGVVYNEMRGAYASSEEYASFRLDKLLYPGGCYGYDSGGNPDAITDLTYEKFCETHRKHYHPSSAFVFLDGSVDLEATLKLIDSYVGEYEKGDCLDVMEKGGEVVADAEAGSHPEIKENECEVYLALRCDGESKEDLFALTVIEDVIASGNSSRLKKKILDTGLCENFYFYVSTGTKYPSVRTRFVGVKVGQEEEVVRVYREELKAIAEEGFDSEALTATLNAVEFRTRENDYGNFPRGMVLMSSVFEAVTQGEDPAESLRYSGTFKYARDRIGTDYYKNLLGKLLIATEARFTLYHADAPEEESPALSLTDEQIEVIKRKNEELSRYQKTEDSPEALATLPKLAISDLETKFEKTPTEICEISGVKTLFHPLSTDGICYLNVYFDVSDAQAEELPLLSLLTCCYRDFDTEQRCADDFDKEIKKHLGSLGIKLVPIKAKSGAKNYICVKLSCLDGEKEAATELLREYLCGVKFDTAGVLLRKIKQLRIKAKSILAEHGHAIGIARGAAMQSVHGVINEYTSGYSFFKRMKELPDTDEGIREISETFEKFREKYFTRKRALVSLTGAKDLKLARDVLSYVPEGDSVSGACPLKPLEKRNEFIPISSPVGYSVFTCNLADKEGESHTGALFTLNSVLTYEILWDAVRVRGGAYDTGFMTGGINSGVVSFYSYRDPSPLQSVGLFHRCGGLLREFLDTVTDVDEYVVGAYGQYDTILTPRAEGNGATEFYLSEITHEQRVECRRQTIDTTREELLRLSDVLDAISNKGVGIVLASASLAKETDGFELLEEL